MGFGIPIKEFMLTKQYKAILNDIVLNEAKSDGIFDYKVLDNWIKNVDKIERRHLDALWVASSFQIWKNQLKIKLL
jgi:hypothetical protein